MRWVRATPRFVEHMAGRHPWLFVAASIVFWTLFAPLALLWLLLWSIDRCSSRDRSPAARRERRVTRMLRWYPASWRARYGDEMAALLDDMISDRRSVLLLEANVAREGLAAHWVPPARRNTMAALFLGFCSIPLVPQGLVPAVMKITGTPTRSWFLALYLPPMYQWLLISVMIALGLGMLGAGLRLVSTAPEPLPA